MVTENPSQGEEGSILRGKGEINAEPCQTPGLVPSVAFRKKTKLITCDARSMNAVLGNSLDLSSIPSLKKHTYTCCLSVCVCVRTRALFVCFASLRVMRVYALK